MVLSWRLLKTFVVPQKMKAQFITVISWFKKFCHSDCNDLDDLARLGRLKTFDSILQSIEANPGSSEYQANLTACSPGLFFIFTTSIISSISTCNVQPFMVLFVQFSVSCVNKQVYMM